MALLRILFPALIVATSVLVALIRHSMAGYGGCALVVIDIQNCFTSGGALEVPDGDAVIPVVNRLRSEYARLFDVVVLSQDWHCSDHVSFASQHDGRQPFDRISLTYLTTGELCAEGSVSSKYAVDCSGQSTDTIQLMQVLWPDHCIINRSDSSFHSRLDILPTDLVVQKGHRCHIDSYSAFYDNGHVTQTELDSLLKARNIATLYIVGLATDYCVYFTAMDAIALGYETYVVLDGTRGISVETVDAALSAMKQSGVKIINSMDLAATFSPNAAVVKSQSLFRTVASCLLLFAIEQLVCRL